MQDSITAEVERPWDESDVNAYVWQTGQSVALLKEMAVCIEVAHKANPECWSLQGNRDGSIALNLWGLITVSFWPNTNCVILPGTPDDNRWASLIGKTSKVRFPDNAIFRQEQIAREQCIDLFDHHRADIHEALRFLANRRDTATASRHLEHRPDLIASLSRISGRPLSQPSHFNPEYVARDHHISDHWLMPNPAHPVINWKHQHRIPYVRFVWPNPPVDLASLPTQPGDFADALQEFDIDKASATRLHRFVHGIKFGDTFTVAGGPFGYVFATGTVTGDYVYAPDDSEYPHRRPIKQRDGFKQFWITPQEPENDRLRYSWGPIAVTKSEHAALFDTDANSKKDLEIESGEISHSLAGLTINGLMEEFKKKGLSYERDQIATFYTALQTKGFVVLSGISGTGKSKIAQHFVQMMPQPPRSINTPVVADDLITVTVKNYMRKYRRVIIPMAQTPLLPLMDVGTSVVIGLTFGTQTASGRLEKRSHTNGSELTVLYFHGDVAQAIGELPLDTPLYLELLPNDDDTTLDGIAIYLDPPIEPDIAHSVELKNSLFLSVRPDWRDSTSLLGYYNPLTETYEWTEFLRFLLRAVESYRQKDGLAWFVILDEMNLAHVEYYFADLLSIIESGRDKDGWSQEPIRLTYPDAKTENPPPHEIRLPPNLYIIGTVNMDETTHAFSPKVLDRAFTIELTDVDFSDYPTTTSATSQELSDEDRRGLLRAFTRNDTFAQVSKEDIRQAVDDHPEIRVWLQNLNERLAQHQFHFGYRVFDEIAQFIFNADRNGMFDNWHAAFDHGVYMKVLPKFNGSHARLHGPLTSLREWANNPAGSVSVPLTALGDGSDESGEVVAPIAHASPRLDRVATRAERMLTILEAEGFVSFG